jgi:hypothetical protein
MDEGRAVTCFVVARMTPVSHGDWPVLNSAVGTNPKTSIVNLQQLRDYIRTQLDVDEEELPNSLLDSYLDEGFQRTISMENRWPFYETRWTLSKVADIATITLPPNCDAAGIMSLVDATNGYRLMEVANELAEDSFVGMWSTSSNPMYYSIFGNALALWPTPPDDLVRTYRMRGYRLPTSWVTAGAGSEPDCDSRLHQLLAHYAIALAYAQQEDEVLEDVYMKRWQASYLAAHSAICNPRHHRPLIFNGGLPVTPSYNPVVWGPPVAS